MMFSIRKYLPDKSLFLRWGNFSACSPLYTQESGLIQRRRRTGTPAAAQREKDDTPVEIIEWIVILLPVPVIAVLILRDTARLGLAARTRCWWAVGSLCLFPVVPVVYLALRRKTALMEKEELE